MLYHQMSQHAANHVPVMKFHGINAHAHRQRHQQRVKIAKLQKKVTVVKKYINEIVKLLALTVDELNQTKRQVARDRDYINTMGATMVVMLRREGLPMAVAVGVQPSLPSVSADRTGASNREH